MKDTDLKFDTKGANRGVENSKTDGLGGKATRRKKSVASFTPDWAPTPEAYLLCGILRMNCFSKTDALAAQSIIDESGSLAAVFERHRDEISDVLEVGQTGAQNIETARRLIHQMAYAPLKSGPVLKDIDQLAHYLMLRFGRAQVEQLRLLALDNKQQLIRDVLVATGIYNFVPLDIPALLAHALRNSARSIVLVHNHPAGDPTPSREDLRLTREIREACEVIRVRLDDHIIIAGTRWVSLRGTGWDGVLHPIPLSDPPD